MVEFESLLRDNREVVTPGELVKRFHEADLKSPISDTALKNMGVDPESSVITDLDKFKKGVIRAEVLADMGVEEKDGILQVTSPEQFAKSAQERAMQRLASGGATAVEAEYLGEVSPVTVVTPDPTLKLDEATQAISDHKPRVTLTPIPSQTEQIKALNEYARADAIADRVINGIENGENIVLYANQERVAAPALQDKEPWKDILIDGKIPTISDVVQKKVEEHAASHPDFAAKLGTVHNLDLLSTPRDMALAARDFDTPPNKVVAADSVDGPSHSSLVIADPAIAHRADFSKTQEEANPTSVIIAGVSSKLPSEYVVEMARSTSQPGAVTPSKCEMAFTDSDFDKKQQKDLALKLSVSEAAGNTVAGAMAGKMEESLGIPQSNPLRQSAGVSMPHASTPANDNVVGAKI